MDAWYAKTDAMEIVAPSAIIYNWAGTNYEGHAQKVIAGTVVSVAFGIANIIGPQKHQREEAPGYGSAKNTLMRVITSTIAITAPLGALCAYRNHTQICGGFKYCL